jgi:2,3,4,5-tetrahydropyridine-2-carboxylate N-succinyltransferase
MHFSEIIHELEQGTLRAASKIDGRWTANTLVKTAILEAFKQGSLTDFASHNYPGFIDKSTIPPRSFDVTSGIRMVPGGSSVRAGCFVAKSTVIMPPSFVNIGAYIDAGTMVDSHVLVGSCAQIGKNVHLSAGVIIGGVLEPVGVLPVIIEDECFIGAGAIIVEGIQILTGAVLAPGVTLSKGIPIFDAVKERVLELGEPIPEQAVVVPGSRDLSRSPWTKQAGLSLDCAVIIKYKDEKTKAAVALENILRG